MKALSSKTIDLGLWLPFVCWWLLTPAFLFAQTGPINLNFEQGVIGQVPTGWYFGGTASGYSASLTNLNPLSGSMCAMIERRTTAAQGDYGYLSQGVSAAPFRGKQVRFRAAVRASVSGGGNQAQLWLRVDRPNGQMGFFDNMSNRPITSAEWGYYEINGVVAADASQIVLGIMLLGRGTAWMDDGSFEITAQPDPVLEPARSLTPGGLANVIAFTRLLGYVRHFHPSEEAAATDWDRFAIEGMRAVESAGNTTELAGTLRTLFNPIAPTLCVFLTGEIPVLVSPSPPPKPSGTVQVVVWHHLGFGTGSSQSIYQSSRKYTNAAGGKIPDELDAYREPFRSDLGGGVSCSFPLALFADSTGTWPRGTMPGPTMSIYSARDRATRLAAVALAWNVFQHFYPYFDVVDTDWPSALTAALNSAATDTDETRFLDTLRRLVAALHDGHGRVYNSGIPTPAYGPPFAWDWIEGRLVITHMETRWRGLAPGDVVLSINGKPAATALAEVESLISGATPQWIRYRALTDLYRGNLGESMTLEIEPWVRPGKPTQVTVSRTTPISSLTEPRPAKIAELEPGILYVDLSLVSDSDFNSALPRFEAAQGLIFDMRGYPSNLLPTALFSHIIEQPVTSALWNIPVVAFPDGKEMKFDQSQWDYIQPQAPFLKGKKAFITDGRAISYAESCMGIVENYRLAEIVGGATAGTNGNVNPFTVPGGYQIYWTGMKVLKHDGSQHHGVGILPTVPAARTRSGAAAGVDELLQRAIQIVSPSPMLEIQLTRSGAVAASTIGAGTPVLAGYAVAGVTSGSTPYGVAVYSFKGRDGAIVSEAAVPVSPPTTSARIFVEIRSGAPMSGDAAVPVDVNTGIAIVNLGAVAANVTCTLRDIAGSILATGRGTIAGAAHFAKFVSELDDFAPDFKLPDNFPADIQFGSLDVASDQPLSVLALRIALNQRNETLLTSTPVADLTRTAGGVPHYFPQFVDGGGYRTTLILLNTSAAVETGQLALFGKDGTPLIVNYADGTSGSALSYSMQPGGAFRAQTAGSSQNMAVGWVQVIPDPGTPSPSGAGVFSLSKDGILVTESGIPAASATTHARIYVDHSMNRGTGLAIANPANAETHVTYAAYDKDGSTPAGEAASPLSLPAHGHASLFVSQLIAGLPDEFTGILDISSSQPFAALTMQALTNSRGDFLLTTFPIADATLPAPAPLVFPQVADGGGYVTRFVLLAVGDPSNVNLVFYDDDGKPLAIGNRKGVVK
jgi:C-terminal processing protease CtpA/Prc